MTVVIGGGGVGKTSFIVARVKQLLRLEGQARLQKSSAMIEKFNLDRKIALSLPEKVPVFANFEMLFNMGYEETYSPYFLDE